MGIERRSVSANLKNRGAYHEAAVVSTPFALLGPTLSEFSISGLPRIELGVSAMNPTVLAMDHPITTLMLVVGLISGGVLAYSRMRVDIFPSLNTPKIYVFFDFIGMSPDQIEGFIVNELELYFQYVDGIQDIKSRNIQQVALCELSFFPGTDMGQAMAQVVAMSDRAMAWMPPGSLPPMIMRMDAGSVPVGYLVFESEKTSLGAMGDLAQNIIRPLVQKNVPGTVAISPFGPNMRSIVINVDPHKLLEYNLKPAARRRCPDEGEHVIPAGNIYVKDSMPMVANNATVVDIQQLGQHPAQAGPERLPPRRRDHPGRHRHHLRLCAGQRQEGGPSADHQEGHGLDADRGGRRPQVDADVPRRRPQGREDQLRVRRVAHGGARGRERGHRGCDRRGLDRADDPAVPPRPAERARRRLPTSRWPCSGSLFGLWVTGNTINIMSLGGMALAIGILVDEATVTIENIHVQMEHTPNIATAVLHASNATAVPRLLALLCILSVFIPAFIMEDPLRSLFMPLTLAVGFAMISSYLLSSTFVPIMCVYLLKHKEHHGEQGEKSPGCSTGCSRSTARSWTGSSGCAGWWSRPISAACVLILGLLGLQVGTELFPQIDSGEFVLRFRPPPGRTTS